MGEQQVSIKDPGKENYIWASFNLFLVQVELQVMEEIQGHFSNSNLTLKEIVKVRSRTLTVHEAIDYLQQRLAKRQKRDEPQANVRRSGTVRNSATQSSSSSSSSSSLSKRSVLSKTTDSGAADTNNFSTESVALMGHLSVGGPSKYTVPSGGVDRSYHSAIGAGFTDCDLYGVNLEASQPHGSNAHNVDARYHTVHHAGLSHHSDSTRMTEPSKQMPRDGHHGLVPETGPLQYPVNTTGGHHTVPRAGSSHYSANTKTGMDNPRVPTASHSRSYPGTRSGTSLHSTHQYPKQSYTGSAREDPAGHVIVSQGNTVHPSCIYNSPGYQPSSSTRADRRVHASASEDGRYVNLTDISGSGNQQFRSNGLSKPLSTKERERLYDGNSAIARQTRVSCTEQFSSGMEEGTHTRPPNLSGATDESPNVSSAGKTSQQHRSMSSEHRRQFNTERIPSAEEAAKSRQAQPSRLPYNNESNLTSSKAAGHEANSGAEKHPSPVPSRRTRNSEQKEETTVHHQPLQVQISGQSSQNDLPTKAVPHAQGAFSQEANTPKQDSNVDRNHCEMCDLQGKSICIHCHLFVCGKCKKIYNTDLCDATKEQHRFKDLKGTLESERKSELSSEHYDNMNEGIGNSRKDWSCLRCTFLNPPDHKICAICATTRGLSAMELTKAGSRVCRSCTFHNKENAKVCETCHKTLDLHNSETSV